MESHDLNTTKELCFGTLLCLCSIIGILFNAPSFTYFLTLHPRSNNASYFQRVYQIISMIDLLVCITLLPYIDAAFSTNRQGTLLTNDTVCEVWAFLWTVLPDMSVFMVAFISVSRLILLVRPHKVFLPVRGWLVPIMYCVFTATLKIILRALEITHSVYRARDMLCVEVVKFAEPTNEYKPTPGEGVWYFVITFWACIQSGVPALPIISSCIVSVICIYKSMRGVATQRRNTRQKAVTQRGNARQEAATVTVITIALVYVLFNIPILGYYIYLAQWTFQLLKYNSGTYTIAQFIKSRREYFYTEFLAFYMVPCFLVCFTSLNSVVNPLVYYTRMTPFRYFVNTRSIRLWGKLTRREFAKERK